MASVPVVGVSEERNGCGIERGEDKDECGRQRLGDGVRQGRVSSARLWVRVAGAGRFARLFGATVPIRTTVIYHYRIYKGNLWFTEATSQEKMRSNLGGTRWFFIKKRKRHPNSV